MSGISQSLCICLLTAIFNKEDDIATYTVKAVDDPRTLNKTLLIMPPNNIYTFNELVALWEKKVGKTLEKIYVPEEQLLKDIQGTLTYENLFSYRKFLLAVGEFYICFFYHSCRCSNSI